MCFMTMTLSIYVSFVKTVAVGEGCPPSCVVHFWRAVGLDASSRDCVTRLWYNYEDKINNTMMVNYCNALVTCYSTTRIDAMEDGASVGLLVSVTACEERHGESVSMSRQNWYAFEEGGGRI